MMITSNSKYRAWLRAAMILDIATDPRHLIGKSATATADAEYIRSNVIPSLKRRAHIIKRNAKK